MSVFIDRSFLLRVSPKLQRFTEKKQDLYNFRCPICGDSQKNKTKSRGYVYRKGNDYFYICHNCRVSTSFYNFLDKVDPSLTKEYALERYKNGETGKHNYKKPTFEEVKQSAPQFRDTINLESVESLPDDHFARQYVINRKIPQEHFSQLYFAPDFKKFIDSLGVEKENLREDDPRLVIPFFDENKKLIAVQGRALGESKLRYITVKLQEENEKIYGLDRVDKSKMIYVVEGPIDSLFIDNAIATADSNLQTATKKFDKANITLVFDNEPRNKEICKLIDKAIENHYNVVIWPEMIHSKDINDMIMEGFSVEEIKEIIETNTFVNLRAKAEFMNWKKL